MTRVNLKVQPLPTTKLNQLLTMSQEISCIEKIVEETENLREYTKRVTKPGVLPMEGANQLQALYDQSLEEAQALLTRSMETFSGTATAYLKEQGICKGMTLVDLDGNSFVLEHSDLLIDWRHAGDVKVELLTADKDCRLTFMLGKGATLTAIA